MYLHALSAYRGSLKDILARETALRTVVRDREILVNRLIKVGNKKPKEGHEREHELKLEDAQRELQACESGLLFRALVECDMDSLRLTLFGGIRSHAAFLQEEEAALAHVKRLSFRESLNNRMKEMGHLARVMEDSAAEAVAILDSLHGPDGDFTPSQLHFDLGSDDGSIAPSQSASQAISRSSSMSSLAEMANSNGPPIVPEDLHIDPNARPTSVVRRERSFSPTRSPAPEPAPDSAAPAPPTLARPIMPAVPTAPPPVTQTVYTEREPGMPTFEIPRAPDLSRRPDYSSESEYDDDDDERHHGRGVFGRRHSSSRLQNQGSRRSMRFSSVQPPSMSFGGGGGGGGGARSSYGRRAISESGSIDGGREGGGRKRRGSFFGGLASLFRRGKKHEHDDDDDLENDYPQQPMAYGRGGGGGGGEFDYADARNRLAATQSSAASVRSRRTTAADARADAVMESVMNAGMVTSRPPTRGGAAGDSSDDEQPTSVVRHVNDPKARIKALSDVGRSPAPRPTVSVAPTPAPAPAPAAGRPKLQRKGTGSSSVRPAPTNNNNATGSRAAPQKAASDIGVPPSRWNGTMTSSTSSPVLQVPRAPSGPGIAELANGSMLPLARPAGPAFAPRAANTGTPSAPAETGTLTRKKTKKTKADPREAQLASIVASVGTVPVRSRPQAETVVISAQSLGMSTSSAANTGAAAAAEAQPPRPAFVRNNTNTSTATAPAAMSAPPPRAATIKKKKVKPSTTEVNSVPSAAALPTADDLAASLPRAASGPTSFSTQLPRPDDDPTAFKPGMPLAIAAPATAPGATANKAPAAETESSKPKKALADKEKKAKHMSALHGISDSTWVAPPSPQPNNSAPAASRSMPTPPRRSDVHKGDESLMSVVDRAEGHENVKPSRSYGKGSSSSPSSGTATPTTTRAATGSTLTVPTAGRATPSWLSHTHAGAAAGATSAPMSPQLSKRKSVRLAETSSSGAGLSPSPSMRSTVSSAAAGQPKHGILIQRDPSPAPPRPGSLSNGSIGGGGGGDLWPTRATLRQRMQDSDDSSDEGEGMKAYRAARRALGRGTKDMQTAMQGTHSREEKGKARA